MSASTSEDKSEDKLIYIEKTANPEQNELSNNLKNRLRNYIKKLDGMYALHSVVL